MGEKRGWKSALYLSMTSFDVAKCACCAVAAGESGRDRVGLPKALPSR